MGFVDYVKLVLRRWKDFEGRSGRAEYWWFYLAMLIFEIVERAILEVLKGAPLLGAPIALAITLVALALIVPALAVAFRRMHDIDRSAWWLLLWLVPVVGWIVVIIFAATPGTPGPNRFGPNPITDGPLEEPITS